MTINIDISSTHNKSFSGLQIPNGCFLLEQFISHETRGTLPGVSPFLL